MISILNNIYVISDELIYVMTTYREHVEGLLELIANDLNNLIHLINN